MKNILEYKRVLTVVGAAMTAASGACWGYVYACHELEGKFDSQLETILNEEIEKTRRYYATMYKSFEPEDVSEIGPDEVVVDTQNISIPKEALNTPEGRAKVMEALAKEINPEPELDPEPELKRVNAFDPLEGVDLEELLSSRSSDAPYLVSKEEFDRNDAHYKVFQLTFFEGDGGLIDEEDDLIPETDRVVGDRNLSMFGVLSGNPNILYVQNDETEALFCINRDQRTAEEFLYGPSDDALEHSSMKRRRPRREDE